MTTDEVYDWAAALDEPAFHYAHEAEKALSDAAARAPRAGGEPTTLALVGIGLALLSLRETIQSLGIDAGNALATIADGQAAAGDDHQAAEDEGQALADDDRQAAEDDQAAAPAARRLWAVRDRRERTR